MTLFSKHFCILIIYIELIIKLTSTNNNNEIFSLATINYGHLKSTNNIIKSREETKLLNALESIGFFILTNHGIDKNILDKSWEDTALFFRSSKDNKESVRQTPEYIYGYQDSEILSKLRYYISLL